MWIDELKKMKDASGFTTKQIAKGSGLPEPTLEKIFSGATKDPKLATIQQLVHFLGYTLDDLNPTEKAPAGEQEQFASVNQLADMLVRIGLVDKGGDLTESDFAFLAHIDGLLNTWFFSKRR